MTEMICWPWDGWGEMDKSGESRGDGDGGAADTPLTKQSSGVRLVRSNLERDSEGHSELPRDANL